MFACDFDECPVSGTFTSEEVIAAMQGHIIDQTELTGLYSLNPDVG
jgi:phosphatidylethanolamine-binding protein (PEBP) family uncharacterized protein